MAVSYQALVKCHRRAITEVAKDPNKLADALFENGIISDQTRDQIQLDSTGKTDKARELVTRLEDKMKFFPLRYNDILQVLRECGFGDLVVFLTGKEEEIQIIETGDREGKYK